MTMQMDLGGTTIDVIKKDIKNLHLSVHPPSGRVRISAPLRMKADTIRVFAIAKLDWIRRHQRKLQAQERDAPREYLDRESHWVWGRRYLLKIVEGEPAVRLTHRTLLLQARKGSSQEKRQAILEGWYREQLKTAIVALIAKWEPRLGVSVKRVFVQRMRTRWGSCSPTVGSIRLNTELAKKPNECLEYIVVHEMAHLMEPTHNQRFVALLDSHLPQWQVHRAVLNRLPVRHERWVY